MNVTEFLNTARDMKGYLIAALTDRYLVDYWPMQNATLEGLEDKVLEIHIFNKEQERRLFRSDISGEFYSSVIKEEAGGNAEYYDEYQYLDIDDTRVNHAPNGGFNVQATGGGEYFLPMDHSKNACLQIRYYLEKYPQTGQSRVYKWRLVDFVEGK